MRITLGESPAGVTAHLHHGAAVSACWEAAVILCIDQAAGRDMTVESLRKREGERGAEATGLTIASDVGPDSPDIFSNGKGMIPPIPPIPAANGGAATLADVSQENAKPSTRLMIERCQLKLMKSS